MIRRAILTFQCICIAVAAVAACHAVSEVENVQLSDRSRYTSNPDGILSDATVRALDMACDSLRRAGLAQVAIVALDSIRPSDVFTFAHELFSAWGVGSSESDNGLGILLVRSEREIRFVTGDGLEGIIPDAVAKRIQMRYMVEPFSRGDFDTGMTDGMAAIASVLARDGEVTVDDDPSEEDVPLVALVILLSVVITLVLMVGLISRLSRRCPRCGKAAMRVVRTERIAFGLGITVVRRTRVCSRCGYEDSVDERVDNSFHGPTRGGLGGGMTFGGMGGGRIGGGFGGGHFGGGGAGSKF